LFEIGKGRKICDGEDIAVLTFGHIGNEAVKACRELNTEGIFPAHYDLRFVKPLDEESLHTVFKYFKKIITVEDGCFQGGFGSAVLEFMADHNYQAELIRLGIPDQVIEHGEQEELWAACGYDRQAIQYHARRMVNRKTTNSLVG